MGTKSDEDAMDEAVMDFTMAAERAFPVCNFQGSFSLHALFVNVITAGTVP